MNPSLPGRGTASAAAKQVTPSASGRTKQEMRDLFMFIKQLRGTGRY